MMVGYWLLVLHAVGDYVLQSDWMAQEKTKGWWPAFVHAVTYTLPFAFLFGWQWEPLYLIGITHFVIDHWRLARYVCWIKNFLSPHKAYWQCNKCGKRKDKEEEVLCWTCGGTLGGEMIYTAWRRPWAECQPTGYWANKPVWLTMWLMFITDNTMHVICNGLAWHWWGTGA